MAEIDSLKVKDQLARPEDKGVSVKRYTNTVVLETQPFQISKRDITNSFVLGDATNGVLGAPVIGDGGKQVVLGYDDRDITVQRVVNPNNIHKERFRLDIFNDTSVTDADWNTTTMQLEMTTGEVAQSLSIFKNLQNVVNAQIDITFETGSSSNVTVQLSPNGGSNWETVTVGTLYSFTNTGQDLRYNITASDTVDISLIQVSYNN